MIRVVHPGSGSRIRIPDPDPDFLPIPDPGGQKGTGSSIRIRNTALKFNVGECGTKCAQIHVQFLCNTATVQQGKMSLNTHAPLPSLYPDLRDAVRLAGLPRSRLISRSLLVTRWNLRDVPGRGRGGGAEGRPIGSVHTPAMARSVRVGTNLQHASCKERET
jgi:hypothetical protein